MNILPVRILLMFSILILSSCEKDEGVMVDNSRKELSNTVSFGMTLPPEWNHLQTKGGELAPAAPASTGAVVLRKQLEVGETPTGEKLLMDLVVTDGIEAEYPRMSGDSTGNGQMDGGLSGTALAGNESGNSLRESSGNSPLTRASVAIDENDDLDLGVYSYLMEKNGIEMPEYDASAASQFMVNNFVDISKGYEYTPIKYWPGNAYWLKFFAYRPYITKINVEDNNYLTLEENNGLPKLTYTVPTNINHQVDLQAATTDLVSGDFRNTVNLNFKHLLSAVKFKVGTMKGGVVVDAIWLSGIKDKGDATLDMSKLLVSEDARTVNYEQEFASIENSAQGISAISGTQLGKTFYMLPQTFADGEAKLGLELAFLGSNESDRVTVYSVDRSLKDFTAEWEANKTYTYTINTPAEVGVEVSDVIEGRVKKDLQIKNTGVAQAYIRATIVGNWIIENVPVKGENEIVAAWHSDDEGVFDWGDNQRNPDEKVHWRKGSDGYYYYMTPIEPNGVIPVPLFKSYELTANAPVADAVLEFSIIAQAVIIRDVTKIWPEDIIKNLRGPKN